MSAEKLSTLVVFFGDDHEWETFTAPEMYYPFSYPLWVPSHNITADIDRHIRTIYELWDKSLEIEELVFVCLSEKASKLFSFYKYTDKVLYKNSIPAGATGCCGVWDDIETLPQRIEELSSNVAFHGNF